MMPFLTLGSLYASDIATIAKASTHNVSSSAKNVSAIRTALFALYAEGENDAITGTLTATIITSPDGTHWDTEAFETVVLTKTDAANQQIGKLINLDGVHSVKILKVANADASYSVSNVNLVASGL